MNNITKIIANHLAIVNDNPEMSPNPNIPETKANIKNTTAQNNKPDKPFLFIFLYLSYFFAGLLIVRRLDAIILILTRSYLFLIYYY